MKNDLKTAAQAFIIASILFYLLVAFVSGEPNVLKWEEGSRGWLIVVSLVIGYLWMMVEDSSGHKNGSEGQETAFNSKEKPYVPATRGKVVDGWGENGENVN